MIHAYNELYLNTVMKNIASMVDIAVNAEGMDADEFADVFSTSIVAQKIESAVPDMLAGKSATEMLSLILLKKVKYITVPMNRTPEYWAGWILAKTQWELNISFTELLKIIPLSEIIGMYYPYHEADERKTIEVIKERFPKKESVLKAIRKKRKLTQEQLSILSGVNLRSIRSYEQGKNDLAKAKGETLQMLSAVLECTIEELLK